MARAPSPTPVPKASATPSQFIPVNVGRSKLNELLSAQAGNAFSSCTQPMHESTSVQRAESRSAKGTLAVAGFRWTGHSGSRD
jgi:hypothetical protein